MNGNHTTGVRHSVMIVDDDRIAAVKLQQTLRGMGYDASALAGSAAEAVARASAKRPDIVLIAIGLAGGIDAAEVLHSRLGLPIVYLVDQNDDALIEQTRRTQPSGYLVRPIRPVELRSILELSLHRQQNGQRTRPGPGVGGIATGQRPVRRTTVLLADDHPIVREGLVSLLTENDFEVVGAVGDGLALLEAAGRLRPDVILTDLSMPGLSGLEALARLKAERADARVLVLTMHNDPDLATRATRAGASGFLLKDSAGEELVNAIHQALQGRVYLTPAVTRGVMERLAAPGAPPEPQLTPRQREVLRLIVEGQRMKEIAAAMKLSTRTVESHKYELMRILDIHSTAELVRYALAHRLVAD